MSPPHVSIVAVPETSGVHSTTVSGEPAPPQVPANVSAAPLVVPVTVPPAGGIVSMGGHGEGSVVLVVEVLVDDVVGVVDELVVLDVVEDVVVEDVVVEEVVDAVEDVVVLEVVEVEDVVDDDVVAVEVVDEVVVAVVVLEVVEDVVAAIVLLVVVVPAGGMTVRVKFPEATPLKPSTTMKYFCPAVTLRATREPW